MFHFFISNHANAVKVDTFSQAEKNRKYARKREENGDLQLIKTALSAKNQ